jgi:cobalt/nickel transport system permease protein
MPHSRYGICAGCSALFSGTAVFLHLAANIFNLGFWPCFIVYPLSIKKLIMRQPDKRQDHDISLIAAIIGLQLGAFSVVLETLFFRHIGITPLDVSLSDCSLFIWQIGVVEGIVTVLLLSLYGTQGLDTGLSIPLEKRLAMSAQKGYRRVS